MPHTGTDEQPGRPERDAVAPLGHGSGEVLQIVGSGVKVRYTQSHLKVTWDNGTEVTIRSASCRTTAHVDHIRVAADTVTLTLKALMTVPEPGFSQIELVLAFPESFAADVQRVAAGLNAEREDSRPLEVGKAESAPPMPAWPHAPYGDQPRPLAHEPSPPRVLVSAHGTPVHDGHPPAAPARAAAPAQPHLAELPDIMFQADLATWADDDDWIGLYPSRETTRLITGQPRRQSPEETSSPPSA